MRGTGSERPWWRFRAWSGLSLGCVKCRPELGWSGQEGRDVARCSALRTGEDRAGAAGGCRGLRSRVRCV